MIDGLDSGYRNVAGIKAYDLLRLHINNLNCMTERKSAHPSTCCNEDEGDVMQISKQETCSYTHSLRYPQRASDFLSALLLQVPTSCAARASISLRHELGLRIWETHGCCNEFVYPGRATVQVWQRAFGVRIRRSGRRAWRKLVNG